MLDPNLPDSAYNDAITQICAKFANKNLIQINREKYDLFKNGVSVKFTIDKGVIETKRLKIFDFKDPYNNNFLAVRQVEVVGVSYNRRPDIICFVNGIPLILFELKAPNVDLQHAYSDNLKDYKDAIPDLFHPNAFIMLSNGTDTKVGTITSPYKFFHEWKRIDEGDAGIVSLDTMLRGVCEPRRFMDMFENFILFDESSGKINKILAKNHQYIGVNKVVEQFENIDDLNRKLGVFWHTQGSGKSYSMVFLCQKILRKLGGSYTFLIVADRKELERQLYETFTGVGAVTEENIKTGTRDDLRRLLTENHRFIFSLIHKFSLTKEEKDSGIEYPLITDRKNIIVISDEAHRTQGGSYARNMRFFGIPNASYLGFTGTPIITGDGEDDEVTKNIFGEYVSIYDFKRSIENSATVKLTYLNRGEKLNIENPELDEEIAKVVDNESLDDDQKLKLNAAFKRDYPILTSMPRLNAIAKDLVWHFNERGYQGKGMFVALDKPTAVKMYDLTVNKHWPAYVAELKLRISQCNDLQEKLRLTQKLELVEKTEVCVVVSSEQNEVDKFKKLGLDIETHRRKMVERDLDKEFKDENNPFRLVIVCAMWITGFDAPCVSTMYLDKPLKQHTLMQTIARANRVYDDQKECGLIVDYENVYKKLEEAYATYGDGSNKSDGNDDGIRPLEKIKELALELEISIANIVRYLLTLKYKLKNLIKAQRMQKIAELAKAVDAVSLNEKSRTTFEVMARDVFRKYKALFPEEETKCFIQQYNAIDAIYSQLHQKVKSSDITEIMAKLQKIIDNSVFISGDESHRSYGEVDLSNLTISSLSEAVEKQKGVNGQTLDLMTAVKTQLKRMVAKNPARMKLLEEYKKIIDKYNKGKDMDAVKQALEKLKTLTGKMQKESLRSLKEGLDEETLAIFDLLNKESLTKEESKQVKKVAADTLSKLKEHLLKVEKWREKSQVTAQIKVSIQESLEWLPQDSYPNEELNELSKTVYQHIFTIHSFVHENVA